VNDVLGSEMHSSKRGLGEFIVDRACYVLFCLATIHTPETKSVLSYSGRRHKGRLESFPPCILCEVEDFS
jgi:hypothetical protein